jgi:peptidoglycan/LPS O-acetylase OafA/YrhL
MRRPYRRRGFTLQSLDARHDNLSMAARWREAELDGRLGLAVMASGVALCTVGTLLEPRSRPDIEWAWWAQLLACVFWAGACGAAAGVLRRRRAGLVGALASAASFAIAAVTGPFVTPAGVTFAWLAEMACALVFLSIVVRAIAVSGRPQLQRREPVPVADRVLV